MSNPDKHHYLPIFFLKKWACANGKVFRYYRPVHDVVVSDNAPKHTGYERGLYALDNVSEEHRNIIESGFMRSVDNSAAQALEVLLERGPSGLTDALRKAWTQFLMSLHVRNPFRVEQISRQVAEGVRKTLNASPHEYEQIRKDSDPPTLLGWVEQKAPHIVDNYGKQLLPGIIQHQEIGNQIIQMQWCVLDLSPQPLDLLTSDRPVILSHGISDHRCFIALAISPTRAFLATRDPQFVEDALQGTLKEMAETLNGWVVSQADTSVYAVSPDHKRFVENRLRHRASDL